MDQHLDAQILRNGNEFARGGNGIEPAGGQCLDPAGAAAGVHEFNLVRFHPFDPQHGERRTPEQRREAYRSIKQTFGTLTITRAITCTAAEIVVSMQRLDGTEAWWTFAFEPGEPVRFAAISLKAPER